MDAVGRGALAVLRWMIIFCVGAMVVLVFGNVVLRYGFNSGISISEEAARFLFVWLIFIGAVVAMYDHGHLGVDTLVSRLPVAGKKFCAVLSDVLMLGCCVLLFVGAWKQTIFNMDNAAPVSGVPLGVMHAAAVVSSVGLFLVIASHLLRVLYNKAREDELVQVVDSEERLPDAPLAVGHK
jgi:TRAP-type C4-dicarboxylate transport system permease small subunit